MPVGERVRAWAEGDNLAHPADAEVLAKCHAADDPLLRAAAHTRVASLHLLEFRFEAAEAECLAAAEFLGAATAAGGGRAPLIDAVQLRCWADYVYAEVLDELGRFDAAAARVDAAVALADEHRLEATWGRALSKRVWIARQQGDARGAAAMLRQLAARLSPRSHTLCAALGSTLAWLGRPETALAYARRCLTLPEGHGRRARDHRDLAHVLIRLGSFAEARHHLDAAAAALAAHPPTRAGAYMLMYAEYHLAITTGDWDLAAGIAGNASIGLRGDNLRRHQALLGLARAQRESGRLEAAARTLAMADIGRLGAENRALGLRIEAGLAESRGDWEASATALREAREILALRHLALPLVLLVEAELGVADPSLDGLPGGSIGAATEFNRALATRDQLLMAAAKDLRGPIAVFELGAELLTDPEVDTGRIATLVERGLVEMELLVEQLRPPAPHGDVSAGAPTLSEALGTALATAGPIAEARRVAVAVTGACEQPLAGGAGVVAAALTTLTALLVRAAVPGQGVVVTVADDPPVVSFVVAVEPPLRAGWGPVDAITAVTAGAPTGWALAVSQLVDAGGAVHTDWFAPGQARITIHP